MRNLVISRGVTQRCDYRYNSPFILQNGRNVVCSNFDFPISYTQHFKYSHISFEKNQSHATKCILSY